VAQSLGVRLGTIPDRRVHDGPIWVFSFAGIRSATHAGETMGQDPALQIVVEFTLDEVGKAPGTFGGLGLGQEGFQVLGDHAVEDGLLGGVALVSGGGRAEGAEDYLSKPFNPVLLGARVSAWRA
jgi:hypothetical protein